MSIIFVLPALIYAGITDWKKRLIPNSAVMVLLGIGLVEIFFSSSLIFCITIGERIMGMFIPGMVLFFVYVINPKLSGGGDLKLLASLGLCIGIYNLAGVMAVTCICGVAHCCVFKEKYIPLATYVMIAVVTILMISSLKVI